MSIGGWLCGETELIITSADPHDVLNKIIRAGINISDILFIDALTLQLVIKRKDYDRLIKIIHSGYCDIKIMRHRGAQVFINHVLRRPVLLLGILLLLALNYWIPQYVFFIEVEGNCNISSRQIISAAERCGLYFGCARNNIRSESVKNQLLAEIPGLQWVGINTAGCTATILVKERTENFGASADSATPSNIIASKDGVVRKINVCRGEAACRTGQAVSQGDILISGSTNQGPAIVCKKAEGEVYAETSAEIEAVSLKKVYKRLADYTDRRRFSIIIGKNLINLYKGSGILDATCVKIQEEFSVCLPGGLSLPIKIVTERIRIYSDVELYQVDDTSWLLSGADRYLQNQMIAGTIYRRQDRIWEDENIFGYLINYYCYEMIGQNKTEEYLSFYGQNG